MGDNSAPKRAWLESVPGRAATSPNLSSSYLSPMPKADLYNIDSAFSVEELAVRDSIQRFVD
jgi:hypothetical protein